MVKKHDIRSRTDIQARTTETDARPRNWANEKTQAEARKGWVQRSLDIEINRLRYEREVNRDWPDGAKNSGTLCDHCATDNHDRCYRVVCYCTCRGRLTLQTMSVVWNRNTGGEFYGD